MTTIVLLKRGIALLLALCVFGYFVFPTGNLKNALGVIAMILIVPYVLIREKAGDPDRDPPWGQ
ncbi:MAG: hypothetical protein ACRBC3_18395 [Burkholderiaceae bacterium]